MKKFLLTVLLGTTIYSSPLFAGFETGEGDDELSLKTALKICQGGTEKQFSFNDYEVNDKGNKEFYVERIDRFASSEEIRNQLVMKWLKDLENGVIEEKRVKATWMSIAKNWMISSRIDETYGFTFWMIEINKVELELGLYGVATEIEVPTHIMKQMDSLEKRMDSYIEKNMASYIEKEMDNSSFQSNYNVITNAKKHEEAKPEYYQDYNSSIEFHLQSHKSDFKAMKCNMGSTTYVNLMPVQTNYIPKSILEDVFQYISSPNDDEHMRIKSTPFLLKAYDKLEVSYDIDVTNLDRGVAINLLDTSNNYYQYLPLSMGQNKGSFTVIMPNKECSLSLGFVTKKLEEGNNCDFTINDLKLMKFYRK